MKNDDERLFSFFYGEAEAAEFFAEAVVFAVAVGQGAGVVELELSGALVDEVFIGVDGYHVGHEHVVATEVFDVDNLAFDVQRAFLDERGFDELGFFGVESHFAEFVVFAARANAAPVGGACEGFGGEVDDEFACAGDDVVAVAFGSDADIAHGRVAAERTRPCYGDDVIVFGAVAAGDHDGWQRVYHCPGFERNFHRTLSDE